MRRAELKEFAGAFENKELAMVVMYDPEEPGASRIGGYRGALTFITPNYDEELLSAFALHLHTSTDIDETCEYHMSFTEAIGEGFDDLPENAIVLVEDDKEYIDIPMNICKHVDYRIHPETRECTLRATISDGSIKVSAYDMRGEFNMLPKDKRADVDFNIVGSRIELTFRYFDTFWKKERIAHTEHLHIIDAIGKFFGYDAISMY